MFDELFSDNNLVKAKERPIKKKRTVSSNLTNIKFDDDMEKLLSEMEDTNKSYFITGNAGTGKSSLINAFIERSDKSIAILAPTGIAAVNIGGQTIHSFFKFPPKPISYKNVPVVNEVFKTIYEKVDTIVIDEISQVRSDLLDGINWFYEKNFRIDGKFGNKQMIFVGDLMQLPPVVGRSAEREMMNDSYKTEFFFDAMALENFHYEKIELTKIHRQKDPYFVDILNKIRNGTITQSELNQFNDATVNKPLPSDYITLCSLNQMADSMNSMNLSMVPGETKSYEAIIQGIFEPKNIRVPQELNLKLGAKVMTLTNDMDGKYHNGSIGIVKSFNDDKKTITIEINDVDIEIHQKEFETIRYTYDKDTKKMDYNVVGTFVQFPLILAYAVSVHKSQGLTFDNVKLNIGGQSFCHGQAYVALSRCRSLEGISSTVPLRLSDIIVDKRIEAYLNRPTLKF